MASLKFSSAVVMLLFVSSILSLNLDDEEVIVKRRTEDFYTSEKITGGKGEAKLEHVLQFSQTGSIASRDANCPRVKDGAYKPVGVSSCIVTNKNDKATCVQFTDLFTDVDKIDTITVRAKECRGGYKKNLNCRDVPLVMGDDIQVDFEGVCLSVDEDDVCKEGSPEGCIRYYEVIVNNDGYNLDLLSQPSKNEGGCAPARTQIIVTQDKANLKGLPGRCISSYKCDFEPMNLECTYARCTFDAQNFPIYIHGSVAEPTEELDMDEDYVEDCYKIRVPSNQKSAALDINNPANCGGHDSSKYVVYATAQICGANTLYKEVVHPEPAEEGEFCNSDSHCEMGTKCDMSARPFKCVSDGKSVLVSSK